MRILILLLGFTLTLPACLQTENSSAQDDEFYGTPDITGTPEFMAARVVFIQNCAGTCHQHSFHAMTEEQFITSGRVVKANLAASSIYYRLVGATAGPGPKDMPTGGALTGDELGTIEDWIMGIQ